MPKMFAGDKSQEKILTAAPPADEGGSSSEEEAGFINKSNAATASSDLISGNATAGEGKGYTISCDIIRRNITMLLATKEMTQNQFLKAIGDASPVAFTQFMSMMGKDKGRDNEIYYGAAKFFEDRELRERAERLAEKEALKKKNQSNAPNSNRKRKYDGAGNEGGVLNDSGYYPEQEGSSQLLEPTSIATAGGVSTSSSSSSSTLKSKNWVKPEIDQLIDQVNATNLTADQERVYDDCDEIRRKISVFVDEEAGSITKFSFAIRTTPAVVNRFLARKGKDQGTLTSVPFFVSYFFFCSSY
jgi:hypothetical protein